MPNTGNASARRPDDDATSGLLEAAARAYLWAHDGTQDRLRAHMLVERNTTELPHDDPDMIEFVALARQALADVVAGRA